MSPIPAIMPQGRPRKSGDIHGLFHACRIEGC
jgi:hypothetical protein